MRRDYHRYRREARTGHRILELGDHQVDFIKLLIAGKHEQHGQVGTSREVASLVANHQSFVGFFSHADGGIDALNHFGSHGIHFGMEFKADDLVSQVHYRGTSITPGFLACRLECVQDDKLLQSRNLFVGLGWDVVVGFFAVDNLVEGLVSCSKKFVHPSSRLFASRFHLGNGLFYA